MSDLVLTDASLRVLSVLYKEYKKRRKAGRREQEARYFGDENRIQSEFFPDDQADEIGNICWYLHGKGLLCASPGDDMANMVEFTDDGIAYMENWLARFVGKVFDVVKGVKG